MQTAHKDPLRALIDQHKGGTTRGWSIQPLSISVAETVLAAPSAMTSAAAALRYY